MGNCYHFNRLAFPYFCQKKQQPGLAASSVVTCSKVFQRLLLFFKKQL